VDERTHRHTSRFAVRAANRLSPGRFPAAAAAALTRACVATDTWRDLEFVDVNFGRDDPHVDRWREVPDRPHTLEQAKSLTSFNHFIDIRKGPGRFDDYDGYGYFRGSASVDEHQPARELVGGWARVLADLGGFKVDAGLNFWLWDEYVHAPGHRWYRGCSPALERYSFPQDRKRYRTKRAELAARFPLAEGVGRRGRGVPYSVFLPVDNLARYWFARYRRTRRPEDLGPVLHALQDACIPHHAAGCNGNWHVQYEAALDRVAARRLRDRAFARRALALAATWDRRDPAPPRRLGMRDRLRPPARNWSIEQLVTWMALQAYQEYAATYRGFADGFRPDRESMDRLLLQAAAICVLALLKAGPPSVNRQNDGSGVRGR
jgi:hypothetical protein